MRQIILSLLIALFLINIVVAQDAICADVSVCGVSPPNSEYGYGLVQICDQCYACNSVSDGVCPEDFANNGVRASCRKCPDADCLVNISGNVVIKDRPDAFVPSGLEIYAYHGSSPKEGYNIANTTNTGEGNFSAEISSGEIFLRVKNPDWDSSYHLVELVRGSPEDGIIIEISEGICNENCTGSFGTVCKASCNGRNGCAFPSVNLDDGNFVRTSEQIAQICDDVKMSNERYLYTTDEYLYNMICCDAGVKEINKDAISVDIGLTPDYEFIKDLRSTAIPVTLNGQIYHLVLNLWK